MDMLKKAFGLIVHYFLHLCFFAIKMQCYYIMLLQTAAFSKSWFYVKHFKTSLMMFGITKVEEVACKRS